MAGCFPFPHVWEDLCHTMVHRRPNEWSTDVNRLTRRCTKCGRVKRVMVHKNNLFYGVRTCPGRLYHDTECTGSRAERQAAAPVAAPAVVPRPPDPPPVAPPDARTVILMSGGERYEFTGAQALDAWQRTEGSHNLPFADLPWNGGTVRLHKKHIASVQRKGF